MKEHNDYIYKDALAERLKVSKKTIERGSRGLVKRVRNREGRLTRYYTPADVLKIKKYVDTISPLSVELEHHEDADNAHHSYQRILGWT